MESTNRLQTVTIVESICHFDNCLKKKSWVIKQLSGETKTVCDAKYSMLQFIHK